MDADELVVKATRLKAQRDLLLDQARSARMAADKQEAAAEVDKLATQLLRSLGENLRGRLKSLLEPLCTDALRDIYGPTARFEINFRQTASGKHRAEILTAGEDGFLGPPATTDGGSVCEVLSLVLRVSMLMIHYPRLRPVIILDEPLSTLDENKIPALGGFIRSVVDRLSETGIRLQMIMTAHHLARELAPYADNCCLTRMVNGRTVIVEEKGG